MGNWQWPLVAALGLALAGRAQETNLVANGSFEATGPAEGTPLAWAPAGNPRVRQSLAAAAGRDGKRCARLECREFSGSAPDSHAMLCQTGQIGLSQGQWYRLSFWARAEALLSGSVEVALVNTRRWDNEGLAEVFTPSARWEKQEFVFRAGRAVPAATSRLQFWFKSTGTLWLDDVTLAETTGGVQWHPQLAVEGRKNLVPNSSFECGPANWGSFTDELGGWAGNLYRLESELDGSTAYHGKQSLKLTLAPERQPVYSFDYYEPRRQPVRRIFLANQGWFPVPAEEMLTLSAYLRADAESVAAQLLVCEAPDQYQRRKVVVGRDWQRRGFTFKSRGRFLFVAVGLDWEATGGESATLWVDAVQLERGGQITPYAPSQPLEAFAEVEAPGHITTNVAEGLRIRMRAFNDQDQARTLRGALKLEDFFGEAVYERPVVMHVPAREGASMDFARLSRNRRGFFWAHWSAGPTTQRLRCAVIDPPAPNTSDAFFGFNHAYPWDFLVELAGQAGVRWWRDWSAKWQTVEPQPGRFDFTAADAQIHRVLGLGGQVDVLLPFPAAAWSTTARAAEVSQAAGTDAYLRQRLPLAYAPRELNQFGRYAAEVVRHYRQGPRGGVSTFQVLNEPVYTTYALPSQFGYRLEDYLRLLRTAYAAMKAADSQCQIIGGPGAGPEADLTRDFILQGGLDSVDVLDVHLYDPPRPAENYERVFGAVGQWMRGHGGPKPIWITEWGCYADDDPACLPQAVGDQTMNRCRWPSERAATEHLVKFVAVGLANGVRKLFWHAGVCGAINGPDAGGVLFEYGGTPRKMYAGVATLNRLLALPGECLGRVDRPPVKAYLFRVSGDTVAVAWTSAGQQRWVDLGPGVIAIDLMGNRLAGSALTLTETPVYLLSRHWREVLEGLGGAQAN